jgi:predicted GIY-YIG superfamily endonuclease
MASWSVYIVRCCDGSLYTGVSNDVPARVQRHNDGTGARYTRSRLPVELVWRRRVKDRSAALKLEAAMKKLSRAQKVGLLLKASVQRQARRARRGALSSASR